MTGAVLIFKKRKPPVPAGARCAAAAPPQKHSSGHGGAARGIERLACTFLGLLPRRFPPRQGGGAAPPNQAPSRPQGSVTRKRAACRCVSGSVSTPISAKAGWCAPLSIKYPPGHRGTPCKIGQPSGIFPSPHAAESPPAPPSALCAVRFRRAGRAKSRVCKNADPANSSIGSAAIPSGRSAPRPRTPPRGLPRR